MKVLKYKYQQVIIILLGMIISWNVNAHDPITNYDKIIKNNFTINSHGKIVLNNMYGNIDVKTWDKNQVSIIVTIKVDAKSKDQANTIFDKIDINIDNNSNQVSISTEIEDSQSSWWSSIWNNNSCNSEHFEIQYDITMPETCVLDATNKYGNIDLENLNNSANIWLKYGNMQGGSVNGNFNLDLKYGNASMDRLDALNLTLGYGKFSANKTDDATIVSMYSNLLLNETNNINLDTKYDTYRIGSTNNMVYDGKYDDIEIEYCQSAIVNTKYTAVVIHKLEKELNVECKYGDVNIWDTGTYFETANIDCKYTPIHMKINNPYKITANTSRTDVEIHEDLKYSYKSKEGSSYNFSGTSTRGNIKTNINIDMQYGSLKIH